MKLIDLHEWSSAPELPPEVYSELDAIMPSILSDIDRVRYNRHELESGLISGIPIIVYFNANSPSRGSYGSVAKTIHINAAHEFDYAKLRSTLVHELVHALSKRIKARHTDSPDTSVYSKNIPKLNDDQRLWGSIEEQDAYTRQLIADIKAYFEKFSDHTNRSRIKKELDQIIRGKPDQVEWISRKLAWISNNPTIGYIVTKWASHPNMWRRFKQRLYSAFKGVLYNQ